MTRVAADLVPNAAARNAGPGAAPGFTTALADALMLGTATLRRLPSDAPAVEPGPQPSARPGLARADAATSGSTNTASTAQAAQAEPPAKAEQAADDTATLPRLDPARHPVAAIADLIDGPRGGPRPTGVADRVPIPADHRDEVCCPPPAEADDGAPDAQRAAPAAPGRSDERTQPRVRRPQAPANVEAPRENWPDPLPAGAGALSRSDPASEAVAPQPAVPTLAVAIAAPAPSQSGAPLPSPLRAAASDDPVPGPAASDAPGNPRALVRFDLRHARAFADLAPAWPTMADVVRRETHFAPVMAPTIAEPLPAAEQPVEPAAAPAAALDAAAAHAPVIAQVRQALEALDRPSPAVRGAAVTAEPTAPAPLRVIELQLQPASLGTVTVTLRLSGTGLRVSVAASVRETAQRLAEDRGELAELVRRAGYGDAEVSVDFTPSRGGDGIGDGSRHPDSRERGRRDGGEFGREPAEDGAFHV